MANLCIGTSISSNGQTNAIIVKSSWSSRVFIPVKTKHFNLRSRKNHSICAKANDEAKESVGHAKKAFDKLKNVVDSATEKGEENAEKTCEIVQDIKEKTIRTIEDAWDTVKDTTQKIKDTVVDKVEESKESIKQTAKNIKENMKDES